MTLSDQAYEELLRRILDGRLKAGEAIDRHVLSAELGMSRSPVVDAIQQLSAEGLVEIVPRRGTRVRVITPDDFREHLLFRIALETQAARLYCGASVRGSRQVLERSCDAIENAANGPEAWRADAALHMALAELSGAAVLVEHLRRVLNFRHFIALHMMIPTDEPFRKHGELVEALCTDDPDEAESAIRAHLVFARERILRRGASPGQVLA